MKNHKTLVKQLDTLETVTVKTDDDITREQNLRFWDMANFRKGVASDSFDVISAIADYFGVTIDYLSGSDMPSRDAKVSDAKPDVIALNEQESECLARSLLTETDPCDFPPSYACSFCKYHQECYGKGPMYFRRELRDKITKAAGIPINLCSRRGRYMHTNN